jgi:hypothetical protein
MIERKFKKYMMATECIYKADPESPFKSNEPDLCSIYNEDGDYWIGCWVTGLGFFDVKFPKTTTRELTQEEIEYYNKKSIRINNQQPVQLKVDKEES